MPYVKFGTSRVNDNPSTIWHFGQLPLDEEEIVLVERHRGGAGDIICMRPALRFLREKHPGARLVFRLPTAYHELVADLADEVLPYEVGEFGHSDSWYFCEQCEVKGCVKGFYYYHFFCPAGIHEYETNFRPIKNRIENFCDFVGAPYGAPDLRRLVDVSLVHPELPLEYVLAQMRTAQISKSWPWDRWAEFCERWKRPPLVIIDDKPETREHLEEYKIPFSVYPDTRKDIILVEGESHKTIAFLTWYARAVLTCDSYLLHMAGALRSPCVALFGPTDGNLTCKYYHMTTVIQGTPPPKDSIRCHAPCYYSTTFNRYWCAGKHGACMRNISVDEVIAALNALFE